MNHSEPMEKRTKEASANQRIAEFGSNIAVLTACRTRTEKPLNE